MRNTILSLILLCVCMLCLQGCKSKPKESYTTVVITTKFGDMKLILYNDTPIHHDNFVQQIEKGEYNGTKFHRVIRSFVIQGGDPTSRDSTNKLVWGRGGSSVMPAEILAQHVHKKGALAMARDQVPDKKSNPWQFYIVHGKKTVTKAELDQAEQRIHEFMPAFHYTPEQREIYMSKGGMPELDMNYTVFGELIEGFDVLDKIANVDILYKHDKDIPVEDIEMTVKVLEQPTVM